MLCGGERPTWRMPCGLGLCVWTDARIVVAGFGWLGLDCGGDGDFQWRFILWVVGCGFWFDDDVDAARGYDVVLWVVAAGGY